jgi:hypothetical protein
MSADDTDDEVDYGLGIPFDRERDRERVRDDPPKDEFIHTRCPIAAYNLGYQDALAKMQKDEQLDRFWKPGQILVLDGKCWVVQVVQKLQILSTEKREPQCACPISLQLRKGKRNWNLSGTRVFKESISKAVCQCDCQYCVEDNGCGGNVCKNLEHCQLNPGFVAGVNKAYKRRALCVKCQEKKAQQSGM